jgi:hypothetical protein
MTPSPFWSEVKAQAAAGTVVIIIGSILAGIVYLIHTVPRQLDEVLDNQAQSKGRIDVLERKVDNQGERLIRLEAQK